MALLVLFGACLVRPADAAQPSSPSVLRVPLPQSFAWSPQRARGAWRHTVGGIRVSVRRTAGKSDGTSPPEIEFAASGARSLRFTAEQWEANTGEVRFRADRLDPAHSAVDVLVAWYTGGAHCCTRINVVSLTGTTWKLADLGEWDGEPADVPSPRRGKDGGLVLPMHDDAFDYAFASYAESGVPLKLLRIVDGKVVDVSAEPQYRPWHRQDMLRWQRFCTDPRQHDHNGFCAAYAASAARAGLLSQAWPVVLQHTKDAPFSFCQDESNGDCKGDVKFEHYADALRWFLRQHGYLRD